MGFMDELGLDITELLENKEPTLPPPQLQPKRATAVAVPAVQEQHGNLSDVESRLEKANCYKLLLTDGLFEDASQGTSAWEVQKEVRDFVKSRLERLLGISNKLEPVATSETQNFSAIQILVLRAVADKVLASNRQPAPTPTNEQVLKALVQENPRVVASVPEEVAATPKLKKPRTKKTAKEPSQEAKPPIVTSSSREIEVPMPDGSIKKMPGRQVTSQAGAPVLTNRSVESAFASLAMTQAQALSNNSEATNILSKIK